MPSQPPPHTAEVLPERMLAGVAHRDRWPPPRLAVRPDPPGYRARRGRSVRFVRRAVLSAAVLGAVLLSLTLAHRPAPAGWDWRLSAQLFLADEGLQKELSLTPDQARKANDLARAAAERVQGGSPEDYRPLREIVAAVRADLERLLTPRQMNRLRQVMYQYAASLPVGGAALATDAGLAKRLRLTPEQVERFEAREPFADVLTEGQRREWDRIVGRPYAAALRTPALPRPPAPARLQYLANEAVRVELKLTPKQQRQVTALTRKYEKALARADAGKARLEATGNQEALALLEPAQADRLAQIELQNETSGREDALLLHPRVAEALGLSEEQRKRIASTIEQRFRTDFQSVAPPAPCSTPQRAPDDDEAFRKETAELVRAVLDEKQRAALEGLVGEPFAGRVFVRRLSRPAG